MDVIALERAVLGALVTGALGLRDVADVGEAFTVRDHIELLCLLVALLETRPRARGGIGLICAVHGAYVCGLSWAGGVVVQQGGGRPRCVGYLPNLARMAPRRREALAACETLRSEAVRRWDIERDQEALGRALVDLVEDFAMSWMRKVIDDGGITYEAAGARFGAEHERRWDVRPVDPDALPPLAAVRPWLAALMRGGAHALA